MLIIVKKPAVYFTCRLFILSWWLCCFRLIVCVLLFIQWN